MKESLTMSRTEPAAYGHDAAMVARHADLEARIAQEQARPQPDSDVIAQLKREKLRIKDTLNITS